MNTEKAIEGMETKVKHLRYVGVYVRTSYSEKALRGNRDTDYIFIPVVAFSLKC